MILVLTTSDDPTADYLCRKVVDTGGATVRLNTDEIATTSTVFASGEVMRLDHGSQALEVEAVRAIWYRRPRPVTVPGRGDLAEQRFASLEWGAALEGWLALVPLARWINHPSRIMASSFKLEQLRRAERQGFEVPRWVCTDRRRDALSFWDSVGGEVIGKPLYAGVLERDRPFHDTHIYTSLVERWHLEEGEESLGAPTMLQERILGVDVRVTIVDRRVVAFRLKRPDGAVDVRRDNMRAVDYERVTLPRTLEDGLVGLTQSYGLRFGAIDMIETDRGWVFLELNPNGQWAWLDLIAGADIYCSFLEAFRLKR